MFLNLLIIYKVNNQAKRNSSTLFIYSFFCSVYQKLLAVEVETSCQWHNLFGLVIVVRKMTYDMKVYTKQRCIINFCHMKIIPPLTFSYTYWPLAKIKQWMWAQLDRRWYNCTTTEMMCDKSCLQEQHEGSSFLLLVKEQFDNLMGT